jgi:glyoxylase-like metal-dependent hydrolase (beta-lactamase superfamily II)
MGRKIGLAVGVVFLLAGAGAVHTYSRVIALEAEPVAGDVSVIYGFGGNVGVLGTQRGVVIVDSMTFVAQGRRIRELAERIGGGPVHALINSHYHADHTHGNPGFASGTKVIATQRTRDYLMFFDSGYWDGRAAGTVPNVTFDDRHELRIGGKTIRLYYLGRGHTGGDLVVLFKEDRVIHAGDLFFNRRYPNIDLEGGGSVLEWIATIDRILAIDFDRIIPGHGRVTDRLELQAFQRFLRDLWEQASEAAAAGKTLRETLASVELRHDEGYEATSIPFVMTLDRDFVVRRAWEEASGAVSAAEVPVAKP